MATQSASCRLTSYTTLQLAAQVTQRQQLITITPTAVPSYGVAAQQDVSAPPFASSTVLVGGLIDGIYDS